MQGIVGAGSIGYRFGGSGPGVRSRLLVLSAVLLLLLAGCSAGRAGSGAPSTSVPSASTAAVTTPTVSVQGGGDAVSYADPVHLVVADGSFASVQVSAAGQVLEGSVSADGTSWVSQVPPKPSTSYRVVATVVDGEGGTAQQSMDFTVATVPDDRRVAFTVTPKENTTVGIGQPIVVRFLTPVTERAAMEKVMEVDARTPAGVRVTGGWHWLNSQEVHWRPEEFWKPGTTVHLNMQIAGVKAATNRYGRKNYAQTFTVGASHVTYVDAVTDRAKVYRDGKLVATWLTGTGRPGLATYSGTYIVLGKSQEIVMDSCSARITCDEKDPDYYKEKEYWATRVTASGTFLHAASWDRLLGKANVSHGCIHLSDADAEDFYDHAVIGDVVIVKNTGRGPKERIATQDPGLYDWNLTWTQWTAGSAL